MKNEKLQLYRKRNHQGILMFQMKYLILSRNDWHQSRPSDEFAALPFAGTQEAILQSSWLFENNSKYKLFLEILIVQVMTM